MVARLSTYEGPAERLDDLVRSFQRAVGPVEQMSGYRDAYLLVDRTSGKAVTMTVWESAEAAEASAEQAARLRTMVAEAAGETIASVETYEVALHARVASS